MICLVVFSGFLLCSGVAANIACQMTLSPPRVVVRFEDSLLANCSSTSEIQGIGWESTYGGTGLRTGVSFLPLKINSVKDWNLEPKCYVNMLNTDEQCQNALQVTVYKTPQSVTMSLPSNASTPMIAGQMYQLKCNIIDVAPAKHLYVYWYRGDNITHIETFDDTTRSPINKTSLNYMIAGSEDDGTKIRCEARLKFDSTDLNVVMQSKSQEVTVLYPPAFANAANETVEVLAGKTFSLDCTATGNPAPVYTWKFPDLTQEIIKDENVNEAILSPSFQLPGVYTCTAFNSQGNSTKYFSVIEATEDRTTFAAIIGVFASLGVLLLIAGPFFVTSNGTFSFNKGGII